SELRSALPPAARRVHPHAGDASGYVPPARLPDRRDAAHVCRTAEGAARRADPVPDRVLEGREMTEVTHATGHHEAEHAAPPQGWHRWTAGGWLRALWMAPLFAGIGLGIVLFFRWLGHWHPLFEWNTIVVVAFLTALPLGFLAGTGAFDCGVRSALGAPGRPEAHSGQGARVGKDNFGVNPAHRVI